MKNLRNLAIAHHIRAFVLLLTFVLLLWVARLIFNKWPTCFYTWVLIQDDVLISRKRRTCLRMLIQNVGLIFRRGQRIY